MDHVEIDMGIEFAAIITRSQRSLYGDICSRELEYIAIDLASLTLFYNIS
jgi:hypothetical protein